MRQVFSQDLANGECYAYPQLVWAQAVCALSEVVRQHSQEMN